MKNYVKGKGDFEVQIAKIIEELSLKDDSFLTPEEFYNFIAAVMEINGVLSK